MPSVSIKRNRNVLFNQTNVWLAFKNYRMYLNVNLSHNVAKLSFEFASLTSYMYKIYSFATYLRISDTRLLMSTLHY